MNLLTSLSCFSLFLILSFQESVCQEEFYAKYSCDNADIRTFIVDKHNELRSSVQPPPANMLKMKWHPHAALNAKKWAEACPTGHSKQDFRRTSEWGCGENLYFSSRLIGWPRVLLGWWDEKNDFVYGKGAAENGKVVGHYTQVLALQVFEWPAFYDVTPTRVHSQCTQYFMNAESTAYVPVKSSTGANIYYRFWTGRFCPLNDQFVWHKSWQLGCALHFCPQNPLSYVYVCHYCPAGNEQKRINIPYTPGQRCANCTGACTDEGLCTNYCPYEDDYDECEELEDMCDDPEESMEEELKVKNICKETCHCNRKH